MDIEYTLDQWEWQGTTRSIEIDPEDYQGMSADEIKQAVYAEIRRDAEQNLHLVYAEDDVAREILEANAGEDDNEDDTIELDAGQQADLRERFAARLEG